MVLSSVMRFYYYRGTVKLARKVIFFLISVQTVVVWPASASTGPCGLVLDQLVITQPVVVSLPIVPHGAASVSPKKMSPSYSPTLYFADQSGTLLYGQLELLKREFKTRGQQRLLSQGLAYSHSAPHFVSLNSGKFALLYGQALPSSDSVNDNIQSVLTLSDGNLPSGPMVWKANNKIVWARSRVSAAVDQGGNEKIIATFSQTEDNPNLLSVISLDSKGQQTLLGQIVDSQQSYLTSDPVVASDGRVVVSTQNLTHIFNPDGLGHSVRIWWNGYSSSEVLLLEDSVVLISRNKSHLVYFDLDGRPLSKHSRSIYGAIEAFAKLGNDLVAIKFGVENKEDLGGVRIFNKKGQEVKSIAQTHIQNLPGLNQIVVRPLDALTLDNGDVIFTELVKGKTDTPAPDTDISYLRMIYVRNTPNFQAEVLNFEVPAAENDEAYAMKPTVFQLSGKKIMVQLPDKYDDIIGVIFQLPAHDFEKIKAVQRIALDQRFDQFLKVAVTSGAIHFGLINRNSRNMKVFEVSK